MYEDSVLKIHSNSESDETDSLTQKTAAEHSLARCPHCAPFRIYLNCYQWTPPPNDLGGCGSSSESAAVGNKSLVPLLVQTQVYADLEADGEIWRCQWLSKENISDRFCRSSIVYIICEERHPDIILGRDWLICGVWVIIIIISAPENESLFWGSKRVAICRPKVVFCRFWWKPLLDEHCPSELVWHRRIMRTTRLLKAT